MIIQIEGINNWKNFFKKYLKLNKRIVGEYSVAVVPPKRMAQIPVNDLNVEEDFIYFCFSKFTKSMIAAFVFLSCRHLIF
ncbi:MAG: hypothetical protein C6W54_18330 [Bacillaceae bacterium]|jgi:ABC-type tungstate transport system permease subunit|nr:MAG: hypothetical protein C6W54_18330 [Bacillaceae bacterium]